MSISGGALAEISGTVLQQGGAGILAGAGLVFMLIWLVVVVLTIAGMWKIFSKAGQPGWAAIIPIYNLWVLSKVGDSGVLWFVLTFLFGIPIIKLWIDVAKAFGKGIGFALGMFFLPFVFIPLLGFGSARYQGPPGGPGGGAGAQAM